jgi:hypothetical protein
MRAFLFSNLVIAKIGFALGLTLSLWTPIDSYAADVSEKPAHKLTAVESSPTWADLSLAQKKALLPLENLWPTLEINRKRKWLAVAQNFVNMNEASQALAQERMREWAALSPLQRTQARLNFAQTKQLSSDEKLAKWEAFQALSEDEKQKLPSSRQTTPKGAALTAKPISQDKLTSTPVKKDGQGTSPRIDTGQLNPFTLLPANLQASNRPYAVQ